MSFIQNRTFGLAVEGGFTNFFSLSVFHAMPFSVHPRVPVGGVNVSGKRGCAWEGKGVKGAHTQKSRAGYKTDR